MKISLLPVNSLSNEKQRLLLTKLEIVLITYNRNNLLRNTLTKLASSPFSKCKITILDNCSSDNTIETVKGMVNLFPRLHIITNKINIGGNANIIRAAEISNGIYTWILCDDDKYDFSDCEDVIDSIIEEKYNLIHMGAHEEYWGFGAIAASPRELISKGYPYFKYCSFLPCNLFRTQLFYHSIIQAYSNITNWYPHLPFLIEFYNRDERIYVAKKRIVSAIIGNQTYSSSLLFTKWINTSNYFSKKNEKLVFILNIDITVNNDKRISYNKIIASHGLNFLFKKNRLICLKLFRVTNILQMLLLIISIVFSPLWRLKYYIQNEKRK